MPSARNLVSPVLALAAAWLATAASPPAHAAGVEVWPIDPVYVFYPQGSCRGEAIQLQVWSRTARRWVVHPAHPLVPIDSCQLEDAGVLFNEIRWRCVEEPEPGVQRPSWVTGLDVFDPAVMRTCAINRDGRGWGESDIELTRPPPGETLRSERPSAQIAGSVNIGGLRGGDYDVVIALDVSGATRRERDWLAAQVEAARGFVERMRPRLGSVRIGIVTYPNVRPAREDVGGTAARREVPLTDDAAHLERALRAVLQRGAAGPMGFSGGFAFALRELLAPQPPAHDAARSGARKLLLMAADGERARPFGAGASLDAAFVDPNLERAREATGDGVALHFFALGGISEEASPFVQGLLESNSGSYSRVLDPAATRAFFGQIELPTLSALSVDNASAELPASELEFAPDGHFSATSAFAIGENRIRIAATTSDGQSVEREFLLEFDGSLIRENLLAAERARMQRLRSKRELTIEAEEGQFP